MSSRARSRSVGRTLAATIASASLAITATAGAAVAGGSSTKLVRLGRQWAGELQDSDAYISLFTLNNGDAGAYLADGKDVATLVLGEREGGQLALEPNEGTTVTATVDGDTVSGTVTIDGTAHDFTAERSTGDGGWYRGLKTVDGERLAAGFIVLEDGSARGAIRLGDEVVASPAFDPDDLTLDVPDDGTIKVLPVARFVKRHQTLDPTGAAAASLAEQVPSPYLDPLTQADRTFVIEQEAGTWLAVVARDGTAIGYVCDGASVWGALRGTVDENGLVELEGRGSDRLAFSGTQSGDALAGTLTVDGERSERSLAPAAPGTTGLYRLAEGDTVTWWIQTPAGLKGATQSTSGRRGRTFATSDASGFNSNTAAGAGEAP